MSPTNSDPVRRFRRPSLTGDTPKSNQQTSPLRPQKSMLAPRDFIRVVARIRPKLSNETKISSGVEVQIDNRTMIVSNGRGDKRAFAVDQIYDSQKSNGSQHEVFATFGRDLVNHALKGYNVCIFAYGHTGTGKTYTMLGDSASQCSSGRPGDGTGLLPRFLGEIFRAHEESEDADAVRRSRHYICEYYEVYNEQIKDLLLPMGVERTRKVHVHPRHGVRIENLTTSVVSSASEALQLVAYGNQMRAVAATTMNARSSRSHAIFTFRYEESSETESLAGADSCSSTVTLVDLAGREDQTVSRNKRDQFREMCFINTSLFHLTHLITKLADGPFQGSGSLSDFRNSKLTLLLSPALIGNSRTALVATVAPGQNFYEDTVSTMQFAASVKKIQTKPIVNNKPHNALIAELEAEIKQLQQELAVSKTSGAEREQALVSAEAIIASYRRTWDDLMSQTDEQRMIRHSSLASLGILDSPRGVVKALPKTPTGAFVPFLTKLSDDPPLQGHCNFYLTKPFMSIGSDCDTCDIILEGLGINPVMCEVACFNGMVEISLPQTDGGLHGSAVGASGLSSVVSLFGTGSSSSSRVLVNGKALTTAEPTRKLRHGDCIFLGYAHAFRLVDTSQISGFSPEDNQLDAPSLAKETLKSLDVASAATEVVDETGAQYNAVLPFISHLSARIAKDKVQAFMKALHKVCPLVDEANLITGEVLPTDGIRFELHALTDIFNFATDFPELIVAVLQSRVSRRFMQDSSMMDDPFLSELDAGDASPTSSNLGSPKHVAEGAGELHPMVTSMGLHRHMKIGGEDNLLYVWSLEKFLTRLTGMRDIYQEGSEAKDNFRSVRVKMAQQPFQNPWRESTFADVQILAETVTLARMGLDSSALAAGPRSSMNSLVDFAAAVNREESPMSDAALSVLKAASSLQPPRVPSQTALQPEPLADGGDTAVKMCGGSSAGNAPLDSDAVSLLNRSDDQHPGPGLRRQRGKVNIAHSDVLAAGASMGIAGVPVSRSWDDVPPLTKSTTGVPVSRSLDDVPPLTKSTIGVPLSRSLDDVPPITSSIGLGDSVFPTKLYNEEGESRGPQSIVQSSAEKYQAEKASAELAPQAQQFPKVLDNLSIEGTTPDSRFPAGADGSSGSSDGIRRKPSEVRLPVPQSQATALQPQPPAKQDVLVYCPRTPSQSSLAKARANQDKPQEQVPSRGRKGSPDAAAGEPLGFVGVPGPDSTKDASSAAGSTSMKGSFGCASGAAASACSPSYGSRKSSPGAMHSLSASLRWGSPVAEAPDLPLSARAASSSGHWYQPASRSPLVAARQFSNGGRPAQVPSGCLAYSPRQDYRDATYGWGWPASPTMVQRTASAQARANSASSQTVREPIREPVRQASSLTVPVGYGSGAYGLPAGSSYHYGYGSFVGQAGNAGSLVSHAPTVIRSESGPVVQDLTRAASGSQWADHHGSPSPRRRQIYGPIPRIKWAYYEVVDSSMDTEDHSMQQQGVVSVPSLSSFPSATQL